DRICRSHAVVEEQECSSKAGDRCGHDKSQQLVAIGLVADEPCAGLVLANCYQNMPDGRAMEAPERVNDRISNHGDQGVEHRRRIEGKTRNHWSRYAAQPVLATSYLSPSEGDRVKHRRQCQREQGEIDSTPTENHVAKRQRGESNDSKTHADWEQDRARAKLD